MQLGIFTRAFQDLEMNAAFSKIMRFDFKYIEIVSNRGSKHFDLDQALNSAYYDEFNELLRRYELQVAGITLHRDSQLVMGPHGESTQHFYQGSAEEQIAFGIKRAMLAADVAKEYNIPLVVGYLGCQDFSQYYPWPSKDGWEKQMKLAYERWMPIFEHYEKRGVIFAHEVGPQQIAYDLETAIRVCEMFETNAFRICFDPSNLLLVGVDPSMFVDYLGKKIIHVHGKDAEITHNKNVSGLLPHGDLARPGRGVRFRVPGWGDINWKKLLTSLKLNGYNGVISLEYEDPTFSVEEGLDKSIHFLKPLLFK